MCVRWKPNSSAISAAVIMSMAGRLILASSRVDDLHQLSCVVSDRFVSREHKHRTAWKHMLPYVFESPPWFIDAVTSPNARHRIIVTRFGETEVGSRRADEHQRGHAGHHQRIGVHCKILSAVCMLYRYIPSENPIQNTRKIAA